MGDQLAVTPPRRGRPRLIRLAVSGWLVSVGVLLAVVAAYPLDDSAVRCAAGAEQAPGPMVFAVQACTVVAVAAVGLLAAVTRNRWAIAVGVLATAVIVAIDIGYVLRVDC